MALCVKITLDKEQQAHCQLAKLFQAFKSDNTRTTLTQDSSEEYLEKILSEIDDVNIKAVSNKTTPLHIACYHKYIKFFDILLKRGADFTATNKNGTTVLHQAFYDVLPWFDEMEEVTGRREIALIESVLKAHVESGNSVNPRSADGLSHFHIACASNHLEAVQLFLKSGVSINEAVNKDSLTLPGYTPLHFAARFGRYETVKLLLERGADVLAKDAKKVAPLSLVIIRKLEFIRLRTVRNGEDLKKLIGHTKENDKIIALFVKDKRVPNVDEAGFSKFHAACTLSNSSLAEGVLRHFDVNHAISMVSHIWPGYTALHFAAHFNVKIVKLLLKNGADIEAKDLRGVTPFDLCREKYGTENLYDILLSIPAFKEIRFSDKRKRLSDFILATSTISTLETFFQSTPTGVHLPKNCPVWPGFASSHLAVLFSDDEADYIAERYFYLCSKTIIQDGYGRTPLHLAFYLQKYNLVYIFLKNRLGESNVIDHDCLSHLHIACRCGAKNNVRTLLSKTSSKHDDIINLVYNGKTLASGLNSGSTPLHFTVASGNVDITRMLLQHGADVNARDVDGMTPIHCTLTSCPREHRKEIADLLLLCNLKDAVSNKTGVSHLHVASYTGNECAVKRLLELGANVKSFIVYKKHDNADIDTFFSYYSGYTPLHLALEENHARIVKLLLNCGNETDVLDEKVSGMTMPRLFCAKMFILMFLNDIELQKLIEDSCGLTTLHIACYLRDIRLMQDLLVDSRVDVNAQTHVTSIWPKATPLHVLISSTNNVKDLEYTVQLLLDHGADASLMDSDGVTPLLRVFDIHPEKRFTLHFAREYIHSMLKCQKEFRFNPVNKDGFSHFHVACMFYEHTIVEKFLKNGVDVNLPIYYCNDELTFQTPIHIVVKSCNLDTQLQLQTIDLLLKYGADVNAQDEMGWTPFLEAARKGQSRELLFQRFYKAGADINCRTPDGQTALEIVLNTSIVTKKELEFFLSYSNNLNTFNAVDGTGMISRILFRESANFNRKFIADRIFETPHLFNVDMKGRTPIHNIVANRETSISADEYVCYFEKFIKMDYDIDTQDSTGKTALHMAADFHNKNAILGLLISGADINVTDMNNRTAYILWHELHGPRLKNNSIPYRFRRTPQSVDDDINKSFALHVIRLQYCHLEVNSENKKLADKEVDETEVQSLRAKVSKELNDTKRVKIGTGSLTLSDFISETSLCRPLITSIANREAINEFFESSNRFPELHCVIKLQYRKTIRILRLIEAATDSLREIVGSVGGFLMPEICCHMIIKLLTTTEIKLLIKSAAENETASVMGSNENQRV